MRTRPIIIDVEASGFGQSSYPIEIGLAWNKKKRYCSLITPRDGWTHWDENAEEVHNISRDVLIRHGKDVDRVACDLNDALGEAIVYSDGWVVDNPWINKLFRAAGIQRTFYVSPLERILTEPQMEIWHQTKERLLSEFRLTRHRASEDAFVIQETYMETLLKTS